MIKLFFGLATFFFFIFILCVCGQGYDSLPIWFILSLLSAIIAFVMTIYKATETTVKAAGKAVDFACDLVVVVVSSIIDLFTIKDEARQKVPNAFKIIIQKKKAKAIDVGIFDKRDTPICPMSIEGEGVKEELHVGQVIYLDE